MRHSSKANPIAIKNSSPDYANKHKLIETKGVKEKGVIDERRERVPVIRQFNMLLSQNQELKKELFNADGYKVRREMEGREKEKQKQRERKEMVELRNDNRSHRKIEVTLTDTSMTQRQRGTSQIKIPINSKNEEITDKFQADKFQAKISELEKQNMELKRSLLERAIISSDPNPQFTKIRQQLFSNMKSKLTNLDGIVRQKMIEIGYKVDKLQNTIKFKNNLKNNQSRLSTSRKKLSVVSPYKRQSISTMRQNQSGYNTPRQNQNNQTITQLKQQLFSSQKNTNDLLQKNQNLKQQNSQYKKAYDEMIKSQTKPPINEKPLSNTHKLIQKLQKQNSNLKLKNLSLQKSLNNFLNSSSQISSQDLQKIVKQQQKSIVQLQNKLQNIISQNNELKKSKIYQNSTISQSRLFDHVHNVQQQNSRLNDEILRLNYQLKQKGQEQQHIKIRDAEILRLQEQLKYLFSETKKFESPNNQLKLKLEEADRAIQRIGNVNVKNQSQVQNSLKDLESVKRLLQSIKFNDFENNLKQLGNKYKSILNDKINTLRALNNKTYQVTQLTQQINKNKLSQVQITTKYVNQKSQRQKLQSMVKQQQTEVQILQQQINNLNNILYQYINKKEPQNRVKSQSDDGSRIRQLDEALIDDQTERNVEHLKELERQFKVVSQRLEQIMGKMNRDLRENEDEIRRGENNFI